MLVINYFHEYNPSMNDQNRKKPQKSIDQDKLAAALRENLKKRKQQQRARDVASAASEHQAEKTSSPPLEETPANR